MSSSKLDLSIIIPTIGRRDQVIKLMKSIVKADLINISFEIIVVNQNKVGFFNDILSEFDNVTIKDVDFKGLSKAKNYGFLNSKGQYLIFLDDDSEVYSNSFSSAFNLINEFNYDMVCGKCTDEFGIDSVQVFRKGTFLINESKLEGSFIEATCFIRREILEHYKFDENLGAGVLFGAHEGYDWIMNVLKSKNFICYFSDEVKFYHPQVLVKRGDLTALLRVNSYSYGFVYSRIKNNKSLQVIRRLLLVLVASLFYCFINREKRNYYLVEFFSLIIGYFFTKSSKDILK